MHPELFRIPFTELTVKSYGLMMVLGFLAAIFIIRRLSKSLGHNPDHITSAALYSLISGIAGARIFYVVHYWDSFRDNPTKIAAIWEGGLELLGGVLTAIVVIAVYLRIKKLPVRRYLDFLAIGLLAALALGRVGCLMNGCCFGKPSGSGCSVSFPYDSPAYNSQVRPDAGRGRAEPYLDLPAEFFGYDNLGGYIGATETNKFYTHLKPAGKLTAEQKQLITIGKYKPLPVHPTQIYSSLYAIAISLVLYLHYRKGQRLNPKRGGAFLFRPGSTFALMFVLYGVCRFLMEFLRDDNPFEYGAWAIYKGGTISQNISIFLVIIGVVQYAIFGLMGKAGRR